MSDATDNRFYREPAAPTVDGDPKDTVRAVQLTDDADWEAIAAWCGGKLINHRGVDDEYTTELRLEQSGLGAFEGDWIVRNNYGGVHIVSGNTWPFGEQKTTTTALVDKDELQRLRDIADVARYFVQPDTCGGTDCYHDDDVCVHMDERHATADDAIAAANMPALKTHNERLLQIAARYAELSRAVTEALGLPASTSNDDLIAALPRLQQLAKANGEKARFWGDHFKEVDDANRAALGEHHRPGYTVAELIAKLVKRYDTANESRDRAWGQLAEIGKLLGAEDYDIGEVLPLVERYLDQVKLVTDRQAQEGRDLTRLADAVNHALDLTPFTSVDGLIEALASRPAIPAAALAKPDGVLYAKLRDWFDEPLNRDSSQSAADVAVSAVNWYQRTAPVSGSDTGRTVICASLRQREEILAAAEDAWRQGHWVFAPAANGSVSAAEHGRIHRERIDQADVVLVIAKPDGTLGESATGEREYAEAHGKPVRYWASPVSGTDTTTDEAGGA